MNSLILSFVTSLLLLAVVSVRSTSSASFPNPPHMPSQYASQDDWALFWKLLHNYYAIIARPRFGKRFDPILSQQEHQPIVSIFGHQSVPSPSQKDIKYMLSETDQNADDQRMNSDELFALIYPDRRRRRRR